MNPAESLLPTRSTDGLGALDIFYAEFNDIHFYVEDEDQENLYEMILCKAFPTLRISRIFPLGGKPAVISHCRDSVDDPSKPLGIYIVDKDFDDLLGSCQTIPRLFYLSRFCIENYFLDADSLTEFIVECEPKRRRAEIISIINWNLMIDELSRFMRMLFQLFFCVQKFDLGLKNSAHPPEKFYSCARNWIVNQSEIDDYIHGIRMAAAETPYCDQVRDPLSNQEVAELANLDIHSVVSGKHMCKMIFHYVKSRFYVGSITFDSFVYRMAKNCSLNSFDVDADRIKNAVRSLRPSLLANE